MHSVWPAMDDQHAWVLLRRVQTSRWEHPTGDGCAVERGQLQVDRLDLSKGEQRLSVSVCCTDLSLILEAQSFAVPNHDLTAGGAAGPRACRCVGGGLGGGDQPARVD